MPIYEYRCLECAQIFEEWQKDFADRQMPCPVCGGSSERLISSTAFHLKGSGWYVTDYCQGKSGSGGNGSTGDKPASEGKSEGQAAGQTAAKADSPAAPCASACAAGGCSSAGGCTS